MLKKHKTTIIALETRKPMQCITNSNFKLKFDLGIFYLSYRKLSTGFRILIF